MAYHVQYMLSWMKTRGARVPSKWSRIPLISIDQEMVAFVVLNPTQHCQASKVLGPGTQ